MAAACARPHKAAVLCSGLCAVNLNRIEHLLFAEIENHPTDIVLLERHRAIEARGAAGMAGAGADLLHPDQQRILVAVDPHLDDALSVSRGLALAPELGARAAVVPRLAGGERLRHRLLVHVGEHEHLGGRGVGDDARNEARGVELGREHPALLDLLGAGARRKDRGFAHGFFLGEPCAGASQRDGLRTSVMNRACSAGSSRNSPVNWLVTVFTPGFSAPRSDMQVCSASSITATPRGLSTSSMAVMICEFRCSWVCRRRA